jgi:hypothetical protein
MVPGAAGPSRVHIQAIGGGRVNVSARRRVQCSGAPFRLRPARPWPLTTAGWSSVRGLVAWILCVLATSPALTAFGEATASAGTVLSDVSVSPSFFNPTLGQKQSIRAHAARSGTLVVEILDRDRVAIRTLEPLQIAAGEVTAIWDGKDQGGRVVPDEAYNLRLTFTEGTKSEVYSPSEYFHPVPQDAKVHFYSREDGVLSYTLAKPSRVHAQAGQASTDPRTKERREVVLKTLVDDSPRVAGSVIEKWNGMDEGGTILVPELPDFVVAILAMPLPPNAMITIGNAKETFFDYARRHRPADALRPRDLRAATGSHHAGLSALEDHTPPLEVRPSATWDTRKREWETSLPLHVMVTVGGGGAPYFLGQPTALSVTVDEKEVLNLKQPGSPATFSLGPRELSPGVHQVAFNWASRLGPTAVNAMRVQILPAHLSDHRGDR